MRERKVLAIPPSWYVRFTAEIGIIYWSIYDRPTLKRGGGGKCYDLVLLSNRSNKVADTCVRLLRGNFFL